jgi:hypothetical protein
LIELVGGVILIHQMTPPTESSLNAFNVSNWRTVMSVFGDALGFVKSVGQNSWDAVKGVVAGGTHLAEDGYKLATDSHYREQAWNTAINDAKAAANLTATAVRDGDAAKEQFGSWIDSGEKFLENKVDDGRAWLRQHGGIAGQAASDWIGFQEGVGQSLYDAGKGLVQLADGVQSLTNPVEWAVNPDANVARVKSVVNSVEALGKIAGLADPARWITDPQGNARLAGALWHSAATSFDKDPAKFTGNVVGTIGTLFIPGADGAAAAGDAGRAAALLGDAGKLANVTEDAGRVSTLAGDAGKVAAIGEDAGKGAAVTDASKAATVGATEKPVQIALRGVDHTIPDWHMEEISYTKRTDAAREALRAAFPPVRRAFVKDLAQNHAAVLRDAGMTDSDIAMMAKGRVPSGYQVHHLLPLDDGGTNATSNLVLIKNDPDHMLITRYQIERTQGMSAGQTRKLEWPMPDSQVRVWPETAGGGAYPTKH